jgi:hypothetical protein
MLNNHPTAGAGGLDSAEELVDIAFVGGLVDLM